MTSDGSWRDPREGAHDGDVTSGEDLTVLVGWEVQQYRPAAVLCIRSVEFSELLVGRRARSG